MAASSAPSADTDGTYLTGHLLIAMPGMQDPRFDHSVVCLCAHSADGAMGLVVNRPLAGLEFDDLLRQLEVAPLPPQRRIRMLDGGPVEHGRGFVLHSDDWSTDGSMPVMQGLTLTASVDILKAIAGGGGPKDCVLALGYAGWAPGQLEDEIQRNAWLNVPADGSLVFRDDTSHTWEAALAKLRVDPALLSGSAGHA
ncbi:YqgE/AlgH family protein [Roseomonas sp. CAU 1739]|uniref:YqgE/AlgH family protein n=1 Tax=Roseomonas sp. CAU 1739 TaxID=3140364 RepID=UPI00325B2205